MGISIDSTRLAVHERIARVRNRHVGIYFPILFSFDVEIFYNKNLIKVQDIKIKWLSMRV